MLWAAITAATGYQSGFMSIAVGFVVGLAIRTAGQGSTLPFGVAGALISLAGCVLGNLLAMEWFFAEGQGLSYLEALSSTDAALAVGIMTMTFDPMDLLFYGIAMYFGFKYATVPKGGA